MKYNIKKRDCKYCPKCGKYELEWMACFGEEEMYSAVCPDCGLFFAHEFSDFQVKDEEG